MVIERRAIIGQGDLGLDEGGTDGESEATANGGFVVERGEGVKGKSGKIIIYYKKENGDL